MTDTPKTQKKMSQIERNELRKLVKQRFALLREQTELVEAEFDALLPVLAQQIRAATPPPEPSAELAAAQAECASLNARAEQLAAASETLISDAKKFADALPGSIEHDLDGYHTNLEDVLDMTVDTAEDDGYHDCTQMARERIEQMKIAANVSTAQLREQENDLLLDITLGAIQSDEGRALMQRLPTVQQITATAVPQIEAPVE